MMQTTIMMMLKMLSDDAFFLFHYRDADASQFIMVPLDANDTD